MMFKTTADLREAMNKLYADVESGRVTNTAARMKVQVAKVMLDTIKVEIGAAALGKQFSAVRFDESETAPLPPVVELRRIS